jgi:hypothetical protein
MARPHTKSKPKTSAPKTKTAPPAPVADAALKARYQAELARFESARTNELSGWDEMYEALDAILYSDPPLYLAQGFKSARAFLGQHLPGVNEATARSSIRVARSFDPDDEQKHGISKLGLLLDYLEAAGGAVLEPGVKLNPDRTLIRVRHGKTMRSVAFKELSYDELRVAVRTARGAKASSHTGDSPAAKAVRAALRKEHLGQVGVRLRGEKLDLTGIPVGDLAALSRALRAVRIA